jgi:excisionase family DNA binding protein
MVKMLDDKWMTIEEATKAIGCTRSYVCYLLRRKQLAGQKVGERAWLVDAISVSKFKAEPKKTGRPRSNSENN